MKTSRGFSLEMQVFEGEMCLYDASGLHSGPQHVLLGWDVFYLAYPLHVIQITAKGW